MPPFRLSLCISLLLGSVQLVPQSLAQEAPSDVPKPYIRPDKRVQRQHWSVAPEFFGTPENAQETMDTLRQKGVVFPENDAWTYASYSLYNERLTVRSTPAVLEHVNTLVQQFLQEEQEQLTPRFQWPGMPTLNELSPGVRKYYRALARLPLGTLDQRFESPEAALAYVRQKATEAGLSLPEFRYSTAGRMTAKPIEVTIQGDNLSGIDVLTLICQQMNGRCLFFGYAIIIGRDYEGDVDEMLSQTWPVPAGFFYFDWQPPHEPCSPDTELTGDVIADFLQARRIELPEEATCEYNLDTGELTVRHTRQGHKAIDHLIRQYNNFEHHPGARKKAERELKKKMKPRKKRNR